MSWIDKLFGKKDMPSKIEDADKQSKQQTVQSDTETIRIDYFLEKYRTILLSKDKFIALYRELSDAAILNKKIVAELPKSIIKELDDALAKEEYER